VFYIVLGCRSVPCRIIFEKINPRPGKNMRILGHGLLWLISIIGTIVKLIM
jgi:hypothetical protein